MISPADVWEQAKMVGWILQRLDPVKFAEVDWATLNDEVQAYHKMQEES